MRLPIISADSHITEPPGTYIDRIDKRFRDRAPHLVEENDTDLFVIENMKPIPMGLIAAAGVPSGELTRKGKFKDWPRGGWEPTARIQAQDEDGIAAELLYPSVGMMLCNHPDFDYKKACMDAYNIWLEEYTSHSPERLLPLGQIAMRSPAEGIQDLKDLKARGFKGIMMPGNPQQDDYDSPCYDPFWEAAIELNMPLSFHILTSSGDTFKSRGPRLNAFMSIIRGCQDIMGMLIFSGVFVRHPNLKIVCVEADAGWAPHYMYRMDHAYDRHRAHLGKGAAELPEPPSTYFRENIYLTFQDDYIAFQTRELMNKHRLMWANDYPHSDSTWPHSQTLLDEYLADIPEEDVNLMLHQNVAELYDIHLTAAAA